ncbi:unnamed protein product [Sphenostylis stenocarpa]|uniref:Uncharacterized protein n=1 Tax=Sphenostylis stenocarpa TaxID=92480 RepID=A0AA86T5D9_9FABA|nr:unnamed protein product [Sphenostylis stenocarpa]
MILAKHAICIFAVQSSFSHVSTIQPHAQRESVVRVFHVRTPLLFYYYAIKSCSGMVLVDESEMKGNYHLGYGSKAKVET